MDKNLDAIEAAADAKVGKTARRAERSREKEQDSHTHTHIYMPWSTQVAEKYEALCGHVAQFESSWPVSKL